ncbi:MAG: 50S ribosomal protein L33 [Lentisphaeria bacterium]|nr:50S ribosomal protein L33 [Lentisphaeria bacterium]
MMPQIKGKRIVVTLECTEAKELGMPTSRYMTTKNRSNTPARLELKKYNPFLRRHTLHREMR